MKSDTHTVQQVFQDRRQYRVPFYQRPYVWTRGDQWERLWDDIQEKAEARASGSAHHAHFLGAIVVEPQPTTGLRGVPSFHIIDGQQRLTTLQYVLHGVLHALRVTGTKAFAPHVEACVRNPNRETMLDADVEPYKVWPTFRDRRDFEAAITAETVDVLRERFPDSFKGDDEMYRRGVEHPPALEAIWFYFQRCTEWLEADGDIAERAEALVTAVLNDLSLVCITLGPDDDAQVIFETLNGHATKLLATDLIRNFVFMRAGNDAERLYENHWRQFEADAWSEEQRRGRLVRPRLEWFVQTALQAHSGEEVDVGRIYSAYRDFAGVAKSTTAKSAATQLEVLCRFSQPYLDLVTGEGSSSIAEFGARMAPWDASTVHSVALRIAVSCPDPDVQTRVFRHIESFLVRRAICGLSTKYYNRIFQQLLRDLPDGSAVEALVRTELSKHHTENTRWPRDDEFRRAWLEAPVYPGHLDTPRIRAVLMRLESQLRSSRSEERSPNLDDRLDVEHVMPRSWFAHWPLPGGTSMTEEQVTHACGKRVSGAALDDSETRAMMRHDSVRCIGNLTLLHSGVNRGVQNHDFPTKRNEYFRHSNLQLNRDLMLRSSWDEDAISERGTRLFDAALAIWPGPSV